jgi:hypothetical protein
VTLLEKLSAIETLGVSKCAFCAYDDNGSDEMLDNTLFIYVFSVISNHACHVRCQYMSDFCQSPSRNLLYDELRASL